MEGKGQLADGFLEDTVSLRSCILDGMTARGSPLLTVGKEGIVNVPINPRCL